MTNLLSKTKVELVSELKILQQSFQKLNESFERNTIDFNQLKNTWIKSELLFKTLFENNPQPMWIYDLDTLNFLEINNAAIRQYGYSRSEFYSMKLSDIEQNDNFNKEIKHKQINNYHSIKNQSLHQRKDGERIHVELTSHIVNYNGINACHVLINDISKFKKLEVLQNILIDISDAIVSTPDLNAFFKHIFNELTKLIDTQNLFIALYNEDIHIFSTIFMFDSRDESIIDFPASGTLSNYVLKSGKSQLINKSRHKHLMRIGAVKMIGIPSEIWIGVPIFEKEKAIGVMVTQNYEGENTLTQEDLKILEYVTPAISLAIERKKFIESLKNANERALESERLKAAFLSNMSHEIRTPMNGILGFTELLLDPDLSSEEKENYIEIVHQNGQRMLQTVNNLIEISKIQAGLVHTKFSVIDINKMFNSLLIKHQPEIVAKNLKLQIHIQLSQSDNFIISDESLLTSVFNLLIINAIKYTPTGHIELGCKQKQKGIEFYVSDTGIGISKEKINAIFERFVQVSNENSKSAEGAGLGLSIAKAYIELMKGNIWVESIEGHGSTFYFTLPSNLKEQTSQNHGEQMTAKDQMAGSNFSVEKLNILIVEDDNSSKKLLKLILKNIAKKIITVSTGNECIDHCLNNPNIDLIMMDIKLPDIDGYEVTRTVRVFNQKAIIIAQTAFALSGDHEKAIKAGCNDYISKPINNKALLSLVKKYFNIEKVNQ